jgi:hypothetical protein
MVESRKHFAKPKNPDPKVHKFYGYLYGLSRTSLSEAGRYGRDRE